VINFSPYFVNYISSAIDCPDPTVQPYIVTITCPEDILASGKERSKGECDDFNDEQTFKDLEGKVRVRVHTSLSLDHVRGKCLSFSNGMDWGQGYGCSFIRKTV